MKKLPRTLLEQPVNLQGEGFNLPARSPERLCEFADYLLRERLRSLDEKTLQRALRKDAKDPIARNAMWLRALSLKGRDVINSLPPELRGLGRKLWAYGFQAAACHETITADLRHLLDVRARVNQANALPKAIRESANTRRKFTDDELLAEVTKGLTGEQIAEKHGVTPQAVSKRKAKLARRQ